MAEYALDKTKIHHKWDNTLPPAIEIAPGDTVERGGLESQCTSIERPGTMTGA